jgi:molecular chaperone HscB
MLFMNLASTDFEIFQIQPGYAIDLVTLDAQWRALQAQVHPDRFASEGVSSQRLSSQWAVRVNEAYQRLKNPLQRAAYLCELSGVTVDAERNTAMPTEFLMQQMAWRETLYDAQTLAEVQTLLNEVTQHRQQALTHLQTTLDERKDFVSAAQQVSALMFVERFEQDIDQRLERLEAL